MPLYRMLHDRKSGRFVGASPEPSDGSRSGSSILDYISRTTLLAALQSTLPWYATTHARTSSPSRKYSIFIHCRSREGFCVERSWMMSVAPCMQAVRKSSCRDFAISIKCHNLTIATISRSVSQLVSLSPVSSIPNPL
jgi:hypothetical protein